MSCELPDLAALERNLGYSFKNVELLVEALTHSSFANEKGESTHHNERLEFLGDAVLSLCVSSELFRLFPHAREGDLTRLRSGLVSAFSLADLARELGLDVYLLLGKGEESQGGRGRDALLGDALEAVLGAVFEDGGFAGARKFVQNLFQKRWPDDVLCHETQKDYKTRLQELTQQKYKEKPLYTLHASHGPEHAKIFEVRLVLPDGQSLLARGHSVKRAEQKAAQTALAMLEA